VAYDEDLAARARELLAELTDVDERKMFGDLAFMVNTHMAGGLEGDPRAGAGVPGAPTFSASSRAHASSSPSHSGSSSNWP
jgi:hypothetical protein